MTAKAHALGRYVDGHGFFKPWNSFEMNAHRNRERFPNAPSPFVFSMCVSVGSSALALFQMNGNGKSRRGIGDADSTRELVQFCGKLPRRLALGLNFFSCVRGADDFEYLFAANHVSGHFGLSIVQRSVIWKSEPDACSVRVRFLRGNQHAAPRHIDGLC